MEKEPRRLEFIHRIGYVDQFVDDPDAILPAVQETRIYDLRQLWLCDEEFTQGLDSGEELGRNRTEGVIEGGIVLQAIGSYETQIHYEFAKRRV